MIFDDPKELKRESRLISVLNYFFVKVWKTALNELAHIYNMHKATFYNYLNSKNEVVVESAKQYMEKVDKMFLICLKIRRKH